MRLDYHARCLPLVIEWFYRVIASVPVVVEHDFLPDVSEFFFCDHASPSCLCGEEYFEVCVDVIVVESLSVPVGGDGFFFAFVFVFDVYCSVGLCGVAV